MTRTVWIIYNGHLPGDKFRDFAEWLQRAAERVGIKADLYENNQLLAMMDIEKIWLLPKQELPDFVLFTDKDIYLAKQLEQMGIRVFNRAETIMMSDDKIATYQQLARHRLPIPKTIVAPKMFPNVKNPVFNNLDSIIQQLGFPMVIKEAFGSFGEQVYLVHTKEEMLTTIQQLAGKPFVFQEFIENSYGRDMRLHVVGDQVVAAMTRYSNQDFRSNVTAGGSMKAYHPSRSEIDLAVSASKAIGADFAGVDLLFGANDTPIICEINSNAHIHNMYDCTGINVADDIISYCLKQIETNGGK